MAEHDLFHKVALFCDPHLLVQAEGPLDFLLDQAEYFPQEDIMKAKVALLAQTKNVRACVLDGRRKCCLIDWANWSINQWFTWTPIITVIAGGRAAPRDGGPLRRRLRAPCR